MPNHMSKRGSKRMSKRMSKHISENAFKAHLFIRLMQVYSRRARVFSFLCRQLDLRVGYQHPNNSIIASKVTFAGPAAV